MMKILRSISSNDVVLAVGLAMMGSGIWLWSPAAALVVIGGILVILAVAGEMRRKL